MGRSEPTHLIVGHVNRPHGVKGEVFVQSLTDHPEGIFSPGVVLLPADPDGTEPDFDRPPLRIESVRPFRDGFLVFFGGIRDRDDADTLRRLYLMVAMDALAPLEEGEVFYHQLLGMTVVTTSGVEVGTVREVYELSPADLLEVSTPRGSVFVPYRTEVVVDVDPERGRLVVDPPEGLLEVNE
jgi:16S rRNA processing protein RimM